jgi:elongation factor G
MRQQAPTSVFVFKTSLEQHIGEINFFKVMSGEVTESMDLVNNNSRIQGEVFTVLVTAGKTAQRSANWLPVI